MTAWPGDETAPITGRLRMHLNDTLSAGMHVTQMIAELLVAGIWKGFARRAGGGAWVGGERVGVCA
jgi:hypothetical protein